MANARDKLNAYVTHQTDADEAKFNALLDDLCTEQRREVADKLTFHEATALFDAVNNVLLKYGLFNPANSVPETEKIFELFRDHLTGQPTP